MIRILASGGKRSYGMNFGLTNVPVSNGKLHDLTIFFFCF